MKYRKLQRMAFFIFLGLIAASLTAYYIWGASFGLEGMRSYLSAFHIWAPWVFVAVYTLRTIFIPSTPFMALAGALFGFKYGMVYTVIGGFFSSALMFAIARNLGKEGVEDFLKSKRFRFLQRYNKRLERGGLWDLIILRITPIMPFNVLNLMMGVSKIKTSRYIVGTILGLLPSIALTVYFGDWIARFF